MSSKYKQLIKLLSFFLMITLFSCSDVLDKTDLGNITESTVWNDAGLAEANLNRIYQRLSPSWPVNAASNSDNAPGGGNFMYGRIEENSNSNTFSGGYSIIRDINLFLEGLNSGTIDEATKETLRGQALFFRARMYWVLVTTYGGVPLILEVLTPESENLARPRNRTSECVVQIINDLDEAIDLLPESYDGANFGRITKGAAMAYKGRILIEYASERFDPDQSKNRWQAAYDALFAAKTNVDANGKGLHASYKDMWFDDNSSNPEIIWGRLYNADNTHNRDRRVRPFLPGVGSGNETPTKDLADAYSMKDGKKIDDASSAYSYDPILFWKNRDPRFEATLVWNSAIYPVNNPAPFTTSDVHWAFQRNTTNQEADAAVTRTGLYNRKAVDPALDENEANASTVVWMEIRYAEVLLNLAEAANEVGKGQEALDILFQIRERAGIENNDGRYGLVAGLEGNKDAMRIAILDERRIEFAFEGKRPADLIRRRMIENLNGTERMGYYITKTDAFDALDASGNLLDDRMVLESMVQSGAIDLNDPAVYQTYFTTEIYSVEELSDVPGQDGTDINFDTKYYFFDIPESVINQNPLLEQTFGWSGGTFDPLQ